MNLSLAITGGVSPYHVEIPVLGFTSDVYRSGDPIAVPSAVVGTTTYTATNIRDACGNPLAGSFSQNVIVKALPVITTQPIATTQCAGASTSFTVQATGATAYQWQRNGVDLTNVSPYSNVTSPTLTITGVSAGIAGNFRVRVLDNVVTLCQTLSDEVALTVRALPIVTAPPASVAICNSNNASFTVTATGTDLQYQWQEKVGTGAGPFNNIVNGGVYTGATTATLSLTGVPTWMSTNQYRVVVTGFNTPSTPPVCPVTSSAATLTVNPFATITVQPSDIVKCVGVGSNVFFTVTATGPGITYRWQQDPDGAGGAAGFVDLNNGTVSGVTYAGVTTQTLTLTTITAALNSSQYRVRIITTGSCTLNSSPATLTVRPLPIVTAPPASVAICNLNNALFTVTATGTDLQYQWQEKVGADPFNNIVNGGVYTGATTATLSLTGVPTWMNTNQYRVVVTGFNTPSTLPVCTVTSSAATLTVNPFATITVQPTDVARCVGVGSSASFTVTATATGPGITYQWQQDPDGAGGAAGFVDLNNGTVLGVTYGGVTTQTLTLTPLTAALNSSQYRVRIITTGSCTLNSNAATLSVNLSPVVVSQTPALCEDTFGTGVVNNLDLNTYSGAITGLSGIYILSGSAFQSIGDDRRINWYTTAARTIPVPSVSDVDGLSNGAQFFYRVTVISTGCTADGTITFTINPRPVILAPSYTFCADSPAGFGAASTTANINLLTQIPPADIMGASPPLDRELTFHPTLAGAQNNTGAITTLLIPIFLRE